MPACERVLVIMLDELTEDDMPRIGAELPDAAFSGNFILPNVGFD